MEPEDRDRIAQEILALEHQLADLRRRALGAARPTRRLQGSLRLLVCQLGESEVAVLQDEIDEVLSMCTLAPLPEAPSWVAGLLNYHGTTTPVVDVLARLTRVSRRAEISDLILIRQTPSRPYGLVVQAILDLRTARGEDVQPVPPDLPFAPYVLGVFERDARLLPLIGIERLLEFSEVP